MVMSFLLVSDSGAGRRSDRSGFSAGRAAAVVKVFDGDTIGVRINGRIERVRLIGIDAPELGQKPWGLRAKKKLEEIINSSGRSVWLETDVEPRDRYGRLLAYARSSDGKIVNTEMIRSGFAVQYTFPPNIRHVDEISAAQKQARESGLGIWGRGGLTELPSDYRKAHPRSR